MSLAKSLLRALAPLALLLVATSAGAATLEVTGPPGATVVINDHDLGVLPLDGPLDLPVGTYVVESRLRGYVAFSKRVTLDREDAWQHVQIRLHRLSRGTAVRSSLLFAGLGQIYSGRKVRGWVYITAEATGLGMALVGELQRNNHRKDHLAIMQDYQSQLNQDEVARLRGEAEDSYTAMEDATKLRDTGLIVAVSAIAVSMLDAWLFFPKVAAGPGPVSPTVGALETAPRSYDLSSVHVGVRLNF
jgi:TM2 domain-containing membrane protein YozV